MAYHLQRTIALAVFMDSKARFQSIPSPWQAEGNVLTFNGEVSRETNYFSNSINRNDSYHDCSSWKGILAPSISDFGDIAFRFHLAGYWGFHNPVHHQNLR